MHQTRVLIVDDLDMFTETAKFVWTSAGDLADAAPDAASALAKVSVFLSHLILMDAQIPVMDCTELTRRLKADPAARHIVLVAFTAYALQGDALGLQAAGFDGYIAKPVDVMTLAAEVHFWLEGPDSSQGNRFAWP